MPFTIRVKTEFSYFKNKITRPFQNKSQPSQPRRAIKRRRSLKSAISNRNVKRKRARLTSSKVKGGFKNITL